MAYLCPFTRISFFPAVRNVTCDRQKETNITIRKSAGKRLEQIGTKVEER